MVSNPSLIGLSKDRESLAKRCATFAGAKLSGFTEPFLQGHTQRAARLVIPIARSGYPGDIAIRPDKHRVEVFAGRWWQRAVTLSIRSARFSNSVLQSWSSSKVEQYPFASIRDAGFPVLGVQDEVGRPPAE